MKIYLFVLTKCTNVTDTQTDRQTDGHRITAKAALDAIEHRAAKITIFDQYFALSLS